MNKKEYEVLIVDIDPINKYPIIFNDNDFTIKLKGEIKNFSYANIDNVHSSLFAVIKNVSFYLKFPDSPMKYQCFVNFKLNETDRKKELYNFLISKTVSSNPKI